MKKRNIFCWLLMGTIIFANTDCIKSVDPPGNARITPPPPPPNTIHVDAGRDVILVLPLNETYLNGSYTYTGNSISSISWAHVSGPASFVIENQNALQTKLSNLKEGLYRFELAVTDAGGLIGRDTVQVTVNEEPNNSLVDIYVAGDENGVVLYWKNGQAIALDNVPSYYSGMSIAVLGNNIGVAATKHELWWNDYASKYWANGQEVVLGTYSGATSVALNGSDVYVAGWEWEVNNNLGVGPVAKYWKNGQYVSLTDGTTQGYANSITIVGNDIYVAGEEGNVAKYWKNGQAVLLTNGLNQAFATSIAVVGSDVYVAGSEGGIAKYWKNGTAVPLSQGNATSIAVVGTDVYVAGYEGNYYTYKAKYWKNGHEVLLTNGTNPDIAWSIAVHHDDVYIAITEYNFNTGGRVAKYWKNGQVVLLSNNGVAHSIVVVDR